MSLTGKGSPMQVRLVAADGQTFAGVGYHEQAVRNLPEIQDYRATGADDKLLIDGIEIAAPFLLTVRTNYPQFYKQWSAVSLRDCFGSQEDSPGSNLRVTVRPGTQPLDRPALVEIVFSTANWRNELILLGRINVDELLRRPGATASAYVLKMSIQNRTPRRFADPRTPSRPRHLSRQPPSPMTSKPLPALIAVIDIGTHKTASLLGQVIDGKARMLSFSERRTDGVVKGTVTDLEKLTQCVHEVVNDIERGSNRAVEQVYLSLSGPAAEGERVKGFIAVPAHDGKVTAKDVADAVASAKRLEPPAGRSTLLYMRQPTMLDNRPVGNAVGMTGKRLEVNFWRVTMEESNMRMRVGMVNGLSIRVRDFILASHAAACATASDADKQGGVLVIDMGAGTTDWILYYKEHILCAGSIPVGGEHLTNDLSVALRISRETAEDLKQRFGSALHRETDVNQTIWKDGDKGVGDQQFNRGTITQVLSLRYQETIEFVRKDVLRRLEQIFPGHAVRLDQNMIPSGVILTGGSANLADAAEAVQLVTGASARVGVPDFENESLRKPEYAGVVCLMTAALADAPPAVARPRGFLAQLKALFRF